MGGKKTQREMTDEAMKKFYKFVDDMKKALGVPMVPDMKTGHALWVDMRTLTTKFIISVERIKQFFNALAENKIMATRCRDCETIYFPPQADCAKCRKDNIEWIELPREGKLVTYTVINVKPDSFAHYDDYIVGIAELENGIHITAWVRETDPKNLKIGQKVKLEVVRRKPEDYLTYELVPV